MKPLRIAALSLATVLPFFVFLREDEYGDLMFRVPFFVQVAVGVAFGLGLFLAVLVAIAMRQEISVAVSRAIEAFRSDPLQEKPQGQEERPVKVEVPVREVVCDAPKTEPDVGFNRSMTALTWTIFLLFALVVSVPLALTFISKSSDVVVSEGHSVPRDAASADLVHTTPGNVEANEHVEHWVAKVDSVGSDEPARSGMTDSGYSRKDLEKFFEGKSCQQVRRDQVEFYAEREREGRPNSIWLIEEQAAIEAFACDPNLKYWPASEISEAISDDPSPR